MTGALLITFREGLEAFLVIGIIIAYLNRAGMRQYYGWVFLGVALGVVSSLIVALGMNLLYSGVENEETELYVKVGVMTLAVATLSYMLVWMARNSRSIKGDVERKLDRATDGRSVLALTLLAWVAVLREGFETILFLGALYAGNMGYSAFMGGLIGLALSALVVFGVFKGMTRVPLKVFFRFTGALVALISAGILMNLVGKMQTMEIVPVVRSAFVNLSWLVAGSSKAGELLEAIFGYNPSPSLLQTACYAVYIVAAFYIVFGNVGTRRKDADNPAG